MDTIEGLCWATWIMELTVPPNTSRSKPGDILCRGKRYSWVWAPRAGWWTIIDRKLGKIIGHSNKPGKRPEKEHE